MKQQQEKQIRIVGISVVTSETSAPMDIGTLWQKAGAAGVLKFDAANYGVYTDYENGRAGAFRVVVGSESDAEPGDGQVVVEIPAGAYRVVEDEGKVPDIVTKAWQQVRSNWEDDRTFTVDYERYLGTPEHSKFELHVGVKAV